MYLLGSLVEGNEQVPDGFRTCTREFFVASALPHIALGALDFANSLSWLVLYCYRSHLLCTWVQLNLMLWNSIITQEFEGTLQAASTYSPPFRLYFGYLECVL